MIKLTSKHRVGAIDPNRFETITLVPIVARIVTLALGLFATSSGKVTTLSQGLHEKSLSQGGFLALAKTEYLKRTRTLVRTSANCQNL
jgi:hypothetical protein